MQSYFKDGAEQGDSLTDSMGNVIISKQFLPPRDCSASSSSYLMNLIEQQQQDEEDEEEKVQDFASIVFFIHGYDSHMHASYITHFAKSCTEHGLAFFGIDLPGHGFSSGIKNDVNYHHCLEIYAQFVDHIVSKHPQKKFFLSGESMGGSLALLLGLQYQSASAANFAGCFVVAPVIHNSIESPAFVTWMLRSCILPCLPMARIPFTALKVTRISKIPSLREELLADQLRTNLPFRIKTADSLQRLGHEVDQRVPEIQFPFLVLHGDMDQIIPVSGSLHLMQNSGTKDTWKQLILLPGGYHAALAEAQDTDYYQTIFQFFEKIISK